MMLNRVNLHQIVAFLVLGLLVPSIFYAQDNPVGIGQWRSHLSYETCVAATESEDAVFFASSQAILKVNKSDQSLEHLNKVAGLSDMGVKTIEYHKTEKLLVIAYTNGNIDLLYDNGYVTNLSAIYTNSNIIGDKSINHIYTHGKQIYFSCSFGLVVYDLDLEAFSQTTFTAAKVYACTQLGDSLFISTNQGIYKGVLDGRNLLDFGVWERQGTTQGIAASNYSSKYLINFQNKVYADVSDSLMVYENGAWRHFAGMDVTNSTPLTYWAPSGTTSSAVINLNMSLSYNEDLLLIATKSRTYYSITSSHDLKTNYHGGRSWQVLDLVVDQNNTTWAADDGYMHYNFTNIEPNAPARNLVSDMHVDPSGTLWVTSSPYNTYTAYFNTNGVFRYKDGEWTTFNKWTTPALDSFYDAIRVTSNPKNDKVYIGSFMSGVMEMDPNDNITVYDRNSADATLEGADGDTLRTRIMGLAVDEDGLVWMANSKTYNSLLAVKKLNGEWKAFPSSKFNDYQIEDIVIDRNGYKWIKHVTGKITVFDSGDLDNDSDDRKVELSDGNTVLPNNDVTCLVSDRKGVIWVGTNAGVTIFNCSSNIFSGGCNGNRPIIEQDNFNGYLLEGEEILDIEVDGANRKWVATKNGLFLLSADGYTQLAYFTAENSPLFDNEVAKLAIDGTDGTLYIATQNGIQSYRSDATTGLLRVKEENIKVFPHPVQSGYTGPIAISNLPTDANVKITDISGRLVYETTALGGQAVWYGTDYNGRRAQTGVYLVFIVNDEGTQKAVSKILFMN